jgi:hypothetical protein
MTDSATETRCVVVEREIPSGLDPDPIVESGAA